MYVNIKKVQNFKNSHNIAPVLLLTMWLFSELKSKWSSLLGLLCLINLIVSLLRTIDKQSIDRYKETYGKLQYLFRGNYIIIALLNEWKRTPLVALMILFTARR